jgi:hypothetical protein
VNAIPVKGASVEERKYFLIHKFSSLTGYTPKAVYRKIERGDWQEGRQFVRSPDGRIHICWENYLAWLLKG